MRMSSTRSSQARRQEGLGQWSLCPQSIRSP